MEIKHTNFTAKDCTLYACYCKGLEMGHSVVVLFTNGGCIDRLYVVMDKTIYKCVHTYEPPTI